MAVNIENGSDLQLVENYFTILGKAGCKNSCFQGRSGLHNISTSQYYTEYYKADSFLAFGFRLSWSPDSEEELNHYFQRDGFIERGPPWTFTVYAHLQEVKVASYQLASPAKAARLQLIGQMS